MRILLPLIGAGLALAAIVVMFVGELAGRELSVRLQRRAELIANVVEHVANTVPDEDQVRSVVNAIGDEQEVRMIVVVAGRPPRVLASTHGAWVDMGLHELPNQDVGGDLMAALYAGETHFKTQNSVGEADCTIPITYRHRDGTQSRGAVMVHVDGTAVGALVNMWSTRVGAGLLGLLMLLVCLAGFLQHHHVHRPIDAIIRALDRRSAGEPDVVASILANDEIGRLAATLNDAFRENERVLAEARRLALVAERTSNAVVITDSRRHILWANRGFTQLTGYSPEEVGGRVPEQLLCFEKTEESALEKLHEAVEAGRGVRLELLCRARDGREYWSDLELTPLQSESGELTGFISIESDITERLRLRDAAVEAERRLRLIVEGADLGTWDCDLPSGRLEFNRRGAEMLGYEPGEVPSTVAAWDGTVHPDDLPHMNRAIQDHLEGKSSRFGFEHRRRHKSGRWMWILCSGRILERSRDGRPIRMAGVHLNISDRKEAEHHRLESEHLLRTILDVLPQRVFWKDRESRYLGANRAFLQDAGEDDLIGKGDQDMPWRGAQADFFQACDRRVMESDRAELDIIEPITRADGEVGWLTTCKVPLHGPHGEVTGVLGTYMDITASKLAEERLRASEARLATVFSSLAEGVIVRDAAGRLVACNPAAEAILGVSREMLLSDGCFPNLVRLTDGEGTPIDEEQHPSVQTIRTGQPQRDQVFGVQRPDGTHRWIRINTGLIRATDGTVVSCVASFADITEQLRDRDALRREKERAEAASCAKSEFLANMSHEIRTPMTAILGYAELLQDDAVFYRDSRRRDEAVSAIRRNGDHLLAVINDILDISKVEAGRLTHEQIEFDPAALLAEVVSGLRLRAEGKGLSLELEWHGNIPRRIVSDPLRVRQIMVNLLGNAIKFTEQGRVGVLVTLSEAQGEGTLVVDIRDTGIGMTPEQLDHLFVPFQQADSSMARRFGGTGLGLAISKRVAELLGGSIVVCSEVGAGSAFRLSLPVGPVSSLSLHAPDATSLETTAASNPIGAAAEKLLLSGVRILLAEDGPDNQRLISLHLRKAGAAVTVAENGLRAIEAMTIDARVDGTLRDPAPFDLILMDMQMPEMDGYAAARLLKNRGCGVPIVALTAHAMSGDRAKCLASGCDEYATKPIDRKVLLELCTRLAKGACAFRAPM